ncbi:sugar ABC transporter permease [Mesorhizobium sp. LHD-90]|nr:sugar ABC transporter permease [Mesorhizobium sp. LHD-90]MDQ6435309.1 sugar ABC transporter permease [Mesorhizobium sp. LHD-90]
MQDLPAGKPVVTDTHPSLLDRTMEAAARATPEPLANTVRGLSDRMVAWLFIAPTILLLLAINIFPLIWAIQLSFTNYRANRPNEVVKNIGLQNYERILTDTDTWIAMQTTAHFVFWTILLQTLIGFTLAYLIDRKFRGHAFWTTIILVPMMLSPAVVGNFWRFLYEPQIGLFTYIVSFFTGIATTDILMLSNVKLAPWSIIIVDTWMWTPYVMLICLAGLRSIPDYIYEAAEVDRASNWRQFWSITLPMALPFIMLAVLFRGIENFKMFDMVNLLTGGGPGSTTEVASITLKREAFEKWRTGFSSAFAIILFVAVFGLANIYVKVLNRVKSR